MSKMKALADFLVQAKKPQVIVHPNTLKSFMANFPQAVPVAEPGAGYKIQILTSPFVPEGDLVPWDGAWGYGSVFAPHDPIPVLG